MPEDVKARIVVSVESGDAAKQCDEIQRKLERITAAREKDLKVINQKTEAIERQKRAELELSEATQKSASSTAAGRNRSSRIGELYMPPPGLQPKRQSSSEESAAQRQQAIKEEIAASTRALQKQREELGSVNKLLSERGKLSTNELRIEQAAARVTTAEYREQRTALALLRAELKMTNAERNLFNAKRTGEDPRRILALSNTVKQYREDWLKAQQAAADAGLASRMATEAYEKLTKPLDNSGQSAQKASKLFDILNSKIGRTSQGIQALSSVGRLLTKNIGGLKTELVGGSLWGIATGLAIKNLTYYLDLDNHAWKERVETQKRNIDSMREVMEHNRELTERQKSAMNTIGELHQKEELSNVERLKTSNLLKQLGVDYHNLGIEIDAATGKIKNFDQTNAKLSRLQINREQGDLRKMIKNIETDIAFQDEALKDNSLLALLRGDAEKASKERNKSIAEVSRLRERLKELDRMNPERDAKELDIAKKMDQAHAAALKYQKDAEDRRREQQRINDGHRERLKSLGKELEIENLLIAGDERRARLAKWQNELEKQGLKPEQLKAELAAREQLHQTQQFRHDWGALAERMRQTPMTRFRETAQAAVMADSLEAVRLQSRVTMQNPEMKILQEQVKLLQEVKQGIDTINRALGPQRTNPNIKRS